MNIFLITTAVVGGILYILFKKNNRTKVSLKNDKNVVRKENLTIFYNYYKIPIRVTSEIGELIVEKIEPKSFMAVNKNKVMGFLSFGKNIEIYGIITSGIVQKPMLLNMYKVQNAVQEFHIGLDSAFEDLSLVDEPTKSTLGTALPRLNIVNNTQALLKFQIGSDQICIEGGQSKMYFGEENHGIHMGVTIENIDGILQDYVINKPITDLHLGLISNKALPLYSGVKMEGQPEGKNLNYHTLEMFTKPHRGSLADRTFII